MRTLWGRANSSNVMKVVWLLEELGLPYERTDVGGPFGGTDSAEYRAMNPNGMVPTLHEADGFTLWESNAILRYLASQYPTPAWPQDAQERANVDRWMDWQQTTMGPPQSVVFQQLVRTAPDKRDAAAVQAALTKTTAAWTLLDAQLAGRAYVAGAEFSLADIANGVHVHRWFSFDLPRPGLPHLRRWYDSLLDRPAYCEHCAAPMT